MVVLADAQSQKNSGSRPPLQVQRSLSRRVSFNESTIKQSPTSSVSTTFTDIEAQRNNPPKRKPCFNVCCAWTSLAVGIVIIIILVLGVLSFSFFQSNLPDFHVAGLNVTSIGLATAPNSDTLLSLDMNVTLNATNANEKMPVFYDSMSADVSSGDVSLGTVQLPEMLQQPKGFAELSVHTVLQNVTVDTSDGKDLLKKSQNHQLLVNVVVGGKIHFYISGNKMAGFPFKVICDNIYQGDLDEGITPKCNVKMTPVRNVDPFLSCTVDDDDG